MSAENNSVHYEADIDEKALEHVGLLREANGTWKYKFDIDGNWFTAPTREAAVERAMATYMKAPRQKLLTSDQRDAKADDDEFASCHQRYAHLSLQQLRSKYAELTRDADGLKKAARHEFSENGGRRTGAAVSADGARSITSERLRLGRYIDRRTLHDDQTSAGGAT